MLIGLILISNNIQRAASPYQPTYPQVQVGQQSEVTIPANPRLGTPESLLTISVHAEGPTYVLLISSNTAHTPWTHLEPSTPLPAPKEVATGSRQLDWQPWSGTLGSVGGGVQPPTPVGGVLEVVLRAAGVGLSVVAAGQVRLHIIVAAHKHVVVVLE